MQWEILVAVLIAIGICTAVIEAWTKRAARKNERKSSETGQYLPKEASKNQSK